MFFLKSLKKNFIQIIFLNAIEQVGSDTSIETKKEREESGISTELFDKLNPKDKEEAFRLFEEYKELREQKKIVAQHRNSLTNKYEIARQESKDKKEDQEYIDSVGGLIESDIKIENDNSNSVDLQKLNELYQANLELDDKLEKLENQINSLIKKGIKFSDISSYTNEERLSIVSNSDTHIYSGKKIKFDLRGADGRINSDLYRLINMGNVIPSRVKSLIGNDGKTYIRNTEDNNFYINPNKKTGRLILKDGTEVSIGTIDGNQDNPYLNREKTKGILVENGIIDSPEKINSQLGEEIIRILADGKINNIESETIKGIIEKYNTLSTNDKINTKNLNNKEALYRILETTQGYKEFLTEIESLSLNKKQVEYLQWNIGARINGKISADMYVSFKNSVLHKSGVFEKISDLKGAIRVESKNFEKFAKDFAKMNEDLGYVAEDIIMLSAGLEKDSIIQFSENGEISVYNSNMDFVRSHNAVPNLESRIYEALSNNKNPEESKKTLEDVFSRMSSSESKQKFVSTLKERINTLNLYPKIRDIFTKKGNDGTITFDFPKGFNLSFVDFYGDFDVVRVGTKDYFLVGNEFVAQNGEKLNIRRNSKLKIDTSVKEKYSKMFEIRDFVCDKSKGLNEYLAIYNKLETTKEKEVFIKSIKETIIRFKLFDDSRRLFTIQKGDTYEINIPTEFKSYFGLNEVFGDASCINISGLDFKKKANSFEYKGEKLVLEKGMKLSFNKESGIGEVKRLHEKLPKGDITKIFSEWLIKEKGNMRKTNKVGWCGEWVKILLNGFFSSYGLQEMEWSADGKGWGELFKNAGGKNSLFDKRIVFEKVNITDTKQIMGNEPMFLCYNGGTLGNTESGHIEFYSPGLKGGEYIHSITSNKPGGSGGKPEAFNGSFNKFKTCTGFTGAYRMVLKS